MWSVDAGVDGVIADKLSYNLKIYSKYQFRFLRFRQFENHQGSTFQNCVNFFKIIEHQRRSEFCFCPKRLQIPQYFFYFFTILLKIELSMQLLIEYRYTYLVTYHMWPVEFSRISLFRTVTSWKVALFSLRKKVSGIQTWFMLFSPRRTSNIFRWIGGKTSRGSRHAWRRYMLTA